mgnify:FL=1
MEQSQPSQPSQPQPPRPHKPRVVAVGGGTGTHAVLRGLTPYADTLDITAIISMADSGGSTGRLRDEFGQLPVGDVRNALTALAADSEADEELLRELFRYRFERGSGLSGHSFGNLFLTALTDILGSEEVAINAAARILRTRGRVLPVTTDQVHLRAVYDDGEEVIGEHEFDDCPPVRAHKRVRELSVTPAARLAPAAAAALRDADLIVFGPGDLYPSVLANTVVDGFRDALVESRATVAYVCNLMMRPGQTIGCHAAAHVAEVERYLGRAPDVAIINDAPFPEELLARYRAEGSHPVENDCAHGVCRIIAGDHVAREAITLPSGEVTERTLIRHDPERLVAVLRTLV